MGDVAEINPKPSKVPDDTEVSFVGMAQLDATSARTESESVRRFAEVSKGYTVFQDGDILVAKITPCFENNKIGQAHLQRQVGVGSTEFHVLRPGEHLIDRYLLHFLRQDNVRRKGELRMTGSAGQRRVPAAFLKALEIPLPALDEQRRIAAILDHADTLRTRRRGVIAQLDDLAQSIFLDMFGDPVTNPKALPNGVIGDLVLTADYGTSEKSSETGEIAVLRMNNITYGGDVDLRDLKYMNLPADKFERYTVRFGDVLFNRTNSAELVGKTAVYRGRLPIAYAGYLVRLRVRPGFSPDYLSGVLNSRYGKAVLRGMCKSIVGMANINAKEVRTIPTLIPPPEAQQAYANRIQAVRAGKDLQGAALVELDSLFASLQSRAFSGRL